jgi:hypothetical protein
MSCANLVTLRLNLPPPVADLIDARHRQAGWHLDDIRVYISGIQKRSGEVVDRQIVVAELHPDNPISAAQARQTARALMATADELDQLDGGNR